MKRTVVVFLMALFLPAAVQGQTSERAAAATAASGLNSDAAGRFLAAAAMTRQESNGILLFYDFASRCTLVVPPSETARTYLARPATSRTRVSGPYLARLAWGDLMAVVRGQAPEEAACQADINRLYGAEYDEAVAQYGAITRHAISVLRGATLDGPGATTSAEQRTLTELSRKRLGSLIPQPVLLSAVRSADQVVLIIGQPFSPYRWLAQYQRVPNGGWMFRGAYDARIL